MEEVILEVKNLEKSYGKNNILHNINFKLLEGKIYGFIGENGAGKTTLMRIITGLSKATKGNCIIKDNNKIGGIIERPALMGNMTAYENLKYKMILSNYNKYEQIEKILKRVGLTSVEKKKVKDFSFGMRQRLAIAMALIGNPKLLLLDEPINGLDPTGIIEIRKLLKNLNEELNITILISSHILGEMYQLATDYIFINKGHIVKKVTLEELNKECRRWLNLKVNDLEKARDILMPIVKEDNIKINRDYMEIYNYEDSATIVEKLVLNKILVKEIYFKEDSLEDYYSKIIR